MIAGLICGAFWFAAFLVGQLVVIHRCSALARPGTTNLVLAGCFVGLAVSVFLTCHLLADHLLTHGGTVMGLLWGVLTLICLFILYMPFYYTIASSLSVRTLVLLASQPDGRLPTVRVCERFISRALVGQRLEIMRTNGFLAETARGAFTLTPKGRRLAGIFAKVKRFWRMEAGG
jgi:hypothetical protein